MSEPDTTAPAATEETSRSERRFAWIAIGVGVVALSIAAVVGFVSGVWLPLIFVAVGDIYTVYTVIKAFRRAKQLEAEGR